MLKKALSAVGAVCIAFSLALAPLTAFAADFSIPRSVSYEISSDIGTCSSVVINYKLMLTAAHCVEAVGQEIVVKDLMVGKVFKIDKSVDLALVLLPVELKSISVASERPQIDSDIVVVGYPLGVAQWATVGHVQGFIEAEGRMLISAPIAPGNSGGGVFMQYSDGSWVLVGVVSQVYGLMFNNILPHMGRVIDIDTINKFLKD